MTFPVFRLSWGKIAFCDAIIRGFMRKGESRGMEKKERGDKECLSWQVSSRVLLHWHSPVH